VRESGARPALVLNKCDLCDNPDPFADEARALAPDAPVHVTCAISGRGVEGIRAMLKPGQTCVLLGPSGVGKSALVNQLLGDEVKETGEVRARDRRGRHTTSYRELLPLLGGALVLDTPGLREIQLWGDEESLADVFPDIEALAANCRFSDCRHGREPACAVQQALLDGALTARRLANYIQLRGELEALAERQHRRAQRVERKHRRLLQRDVEEREKPRAKGPR
jgi:ribosome biogenesis GTPase